MTRSWSLRQIAIICGALAACVAIGLAVMVVELRKPTPDILFLEARGVNVLMEFGRRSTPSGLVYLEELAGPFPRYSVPTGIHGKGMAVSADDVKVWNHFEKLRTLRLRSVQGTATSLNELQLPGLTWIEIDGDGVVDHALTFCKHSPLIQRLEVHSRNIEGEFLASLNCWQTLVTLSLEGTQFGDGEVHYLLKANEIEELNLRNTTLSDTGLQELATLQKLRWLNIQDTAVSSDGIRRFGVARPDVAVRGNSK